MLRKFLLSFIILSLVTGFAVSQQGRLQPGLQPGFQPWWFTLELGKQHYRNGSYGDALISFEDARRDRFNQFSRMEQDLIFLLSHPNVRQLEDALDFIEMYIAANLETAAATALSELYYRYPREELQNSGLRALEELDRLKGYPEAEFWLGETYRAEGELNLALRHYERAFNERALLDNPGFEIEILYRMVEVNRSLQNYQEMERRAREIIEGSGLDGVPRDIFWARSPGQSGSMESMRVAMARILEVEGVNHFMTLYRNNNLVTERAHRSLGFFYIATGRHLMAAEHLLFAFLVQNTVLIEEAIRQEFDYTFTSLEDLMNFVLRRRDLLDFIDEVEYYRTIFNLAGSLYVTRRTVPAMQLWSFLAGSANAGEWGARARRSPVPYVERAIELP